MKLEFIQTSDKSKTLYNSELNEHYHSIHGAYQESVHVYVKSGLEVAKSLNPIHVLEVGFGTGLNVLLAHIFAHKNQVKIDLTTIETYPLPQNIWENLNYYSSPKEQEVFSKFHEIEWDKKVKIDSCFDFTKHETSLQDFDTNQKFDVIFFDAFGPEKQPELWEIPIFEKLYSVLNPNGILVTYSAKGQVRRNMQAAGFTVERIPGPPGKREMLRAIRVP